MPFLHAINLLIFHLLWPRCFTDDVYYEFPCMIFLHKALLIIKISTALFAPKGKLSFYINFYSILLSSTMFD